MPNPNGIAWVLGDMGTWHAFFAAKSLREAICGRGRSPVPLTKDPHPVDEPDPAQGKRICAQCKSSSANAKAPAEPQAIVAVQTGAEVVMDDAVKSLHAGTVETIVNGKAPPNRSAADGSMAAHERAMIEVYGGTHEEVTARNAELMDAAEKAIDRAAEVNDGPTLALSVQACIAANMPETASEELEKLVAIMGEGIGADVVANLTAQIEDRVAQTVIDAKRYHEIAGTVFPKAKREAPADKPKRKPPSNKGTKGVEFTKCGGCGKKSVMPTGICRYRACGWTAP